MPVILEIINRPDAADLADLEKIYADYPLPPVQSLSNWLDAQREAGQTLIAGRFNGHLLASLYIDKGGRIDASVRARFDAPARHRPATTATVTGQRRAAATAQTGSA